MPEQKHVLLPEQLKYYVVLFKLEGHSTWRGLFGPTIGNLEKQLVLPFNKAKITTKKFFEIDRITGNFEEF